MSKEINDIIYYDMGERLNIPAAYYRCKSMPDKLRLIIVSLKHHIVNIKSVNRVESSEDFIKWTEDSLPIINKIKSYENKNSYTKKETSNHLIVVHSVYNKQNK